jgi:uncharacterized protein YecE (DUF72 family)
VTRASGGTIRVGIGGWTFAPWRDNFFPKGLPHAQELAYASERLTAIEINGTFYRHQSRESFAAWRDATPAGFVFSVKAHRATTHGKNLAEAGPAIERFVGSGVSELGSKLGPLFWQLPHTKKFDEATMDAFLSMLPREVDGIALRHAVEARHASFLVAAWPELAARHGVAIVIVDSDKQALRGDVTADFVYARLQRNAASAEEGYDGAALDGWAGRLRAWSQGRPADDLACDGPPVKAKRRDCFAFFISGDKERAPLAAMAMLHRLAK